MEPQKFVVRLQDAAGELLAWTTVYGLPKPQPRPHSCPMWATGPTQFPIEKAGEASVITIHWCDLDVARKTTPIEPTHVEPGQVFTYHWIEPLWLVPGSSEMFPLPAVTVRESITVTVPSGGLGVVAGR
jgi:hypothetical protein